MGLRKAMKPWNLPYIILNCSGINGYKKWYLLLSSGKFYMIMLVWFEIFRLDTQKKCFIMK